MGLQDDPDAKKALVAFGRKTRGQTGKALAQEIGGLKSALREMVVDQATSEFRKTYPEHASDPEIQERFLQRLAVEASTGVYEGNPRELYRVAGLVAAGGPPKKRGERDGDAPRRKASAPAMQTRATRTEPRVLDEGTESHDRAAYNRTMKRMRAGFATRR
jgi:hypothetical protein